MRILQVVGICGGGVGRHLKSVVGGLLAGGHDVAVAYTPHGVDDSFKGFLDANADNIPVLPFSVERQVSPRSDLGAMKELLQFAKSHGPFDVIHGHSAKGGVLSRIAGRILRVPTIYTPHSLLSSSPCVSRRAKVSYGSIEALLGWSATSRLVAVSREEYDFVLRNRLLPSRHVALIQNGAENSDLDTAAPLDTKCSLDEKPLTFGSTMRFVHQKDPMNLIKAFERIVRTVPERNVRLVVAGDGEMFPEFARFVDSHDLSSRVDLLGWQSGISSFLREIDVFVVSSLYEGFSYSIVEAMAAMRPVVSTRVFGTAETVQQVPGNVLVPPGDDVALALGMNEMLQVSSRERLQNIGYENHVLVRKNFRQEELTRRIVSLYGEVSKQPVWHHNSA